MALGRIDAAQPERADARRVDSRWQVGKIAAETIGHVNDSIVMLSLMIAEVDGKKILFYHPTSVMVDWNMIWNWLKEVLPEAYSNRTDAGNFHNILR